MSTAEWDAAGRVPGALFAARADLGPGGFSDPVALGNLLSDLLADSPRETRLLVVAAEANVAGSVERLVATVGADEAVAVTARVLSESRAIEPGAAWWVTAQVARALGYQVAEREIGPASVGPWAVAAPAQDGWGPAAGDAPTDALPGARWAGVGPPAPERSEARHPDPSGGGPGPGPTEPGSWGPPVEAPARLAGSVPTLPGPPAAVVGRSRRGPRAVLGIAAVVAVVGLYLAVAAVAQIPPLDHQARSTTTSTPQVAQVALSSLMPDSSLLVHGGYDLTSACRAQAKPAKAVGLILALTCTDIPGHAGWSLTGYKFDSMADYTASFAYYNSLNFPTSDVGTACPPGAGFTAGSMTWSAGQYPIRPDQVLECATESTSGHGAGTGGAAAAAPVYDWTLPSQDAFFELDTAHGASFAELDAWWYRYGQPGPPVTGG